MCEARTVEDALREGTREGTREAEGMPSTSRDSSPETKSRKRLQAELKVAMRAKRSSSVSSALNSLGTEKKQGLSTSEIYRVVLRADSCPHLSRWLTEDETEGITWDFETYYRASETYVCTDQMLLPEALAFLEDDLDKDTETIVAIDLEWKPDRHKSHNNPVALIQLATTTRCVLIRTVDWDTSGAEGLPQPLYDFFSSSENRFFVGFSWDSGDEKKFQSSFGVGKSVFSNFCDLQELAQVLGYGKKSGLAWLTREVVGAELPKTASRSNWARVELTAEQIQYGALDAFSLHAVLHGWRKMNAS